MTLNGRWFPQIVDYVDRDSVNLYPIYIYIYINVVLASEPVGGRFRATELPCYIFVNMYLVYNRTHAPWSECPASACKLTISIQVYSVTVYAPCYSIKGEQSGQGTFEPITPDLFDPNPPLLDLHAVSNGTYVCGTLCYGGSCVPTEA